jgi:glycine cleavage system H protein
MLRSIVNCSKKITSGFKLKIHNRSLYNGILYTKNHETIQFINENEIKIGISDYAKETLTEIVYTDMYDIDTEYEKDDTICILESIKAVAEVHTPFDGTIINHNQDLLDEIEKINKLDEKNSWLIKYKLLNDINIKDFELFEHKTYLEFLKSI